jgi:DNA-binding transcriptional LysR family regulator
LAGRLDFVLGRMPEGPQAQMLTYAPLDGEPLALVARRGHPVLAGTPTLEAALTHDWLLPGAPSLMTRTVLSSLQARGLPAPRRRVSTTSFMLTLALLQETDALAVLALAIARQFSDGPGAALAIVPVDLAVEVEPYGMISRERVSLTPAAQRLADQISGGDQIP